MTRLICIWKNTEALADIAEPTHKKPGITSDAALLEPWATRRPAISGIRSDFEELWAIAVRARKVSNKFQINRGASNYLTPLEYNSPQTTHSERTIYWMQTRREASKIACDEK